MRTLLSLIAAFSLLSACADNPGEGKPRAEVAEPAAPAAPPPAPPADAPTTAGLQVPDLQAPTVLEVDKASSKLGAVGAKITATHDIDFRDFAGKVGLEDDVVTGFAFTIDVGSLQTEPEKLLQHLKSEDFFDVERYPQATFLTTGIAPKPGENGATHEVTGNLTIRGQTKQVTFPAKLEVTPEKVMASTEFVINRQDFGVVYPGKPDDLIKDDVLLKASFVANR